MHRPSPISPPSRKVRPKRAGASPALLVVALLLPGCLADFAYDFGPGGPDAGDGGSAADGGATDGRAQTDGQTGLDGATGSDGAPLPDGTVPGCGNNIRETGEACDGPDLGGATCVSQGINAPMGTLTCTSGCTLNTSGCCPVWTSEVVDDVDTNGSLNLSEVSVALDSQGVPHFAYRHDDLQELRFAYPGTSAMVTQVVDTTGNTGWRPALAFDSQDRPHILYRNDAGQTALAVHNGADWVLDVVDPSASSGPRGIALDSQDRAHVVYLVSQRARYALEGTTSWTTHDLEDDAFMPSIAVDGADRPHIAYLHWPTTDLALRYAHDPGAGWSDTVVEQVGTSVMTMPSGDTSIATDSANHPHIAYQHVTDADLKYARHDGSHWVLEVVDSLGDVGDDVALALDGVGRPHIAFRDDSPETLRYVQWTGSAWVFQSPLLSTGSRLTPDLALDSAGLAHVFFLQMAGTTVDHAYLEACP